jgi:hypothetical protein
MTRDEFDQWMEEHTAHFPGVATWLAKFGEVQERAVLRVWFQHLKASDLQDTLRATVQLFDQGGRSPVYERHPQAIRSIVREIELARTAESLKPRFIDGEQVYNCLLCEDDGRVSCWSRKSMEAAADGTLGEPFTHYSCAVACSCVAGDYHVRFMARYDPKRWLLYPRWTVGEDEFSELREFVAGLGRKEEAVF